MCQEYWNIWLVSDNYGLLRYIHRYLMTRKIQPTNWKFVLTMTWPKWIVKKTGGEIMWILNGGNSIIFLTHIIHRLEKLGYNRYRTQPYSGKKSITTAIASCPLSSLKIKLSRFTRIDLKSKMRRFIQICTEYENKKQTSKWEGEKHLFYFFLNDKALH